MIFQQKKKVKNWNFFDVYFVRGGKSKNVEFDVSYDIAVTLQFLLSMVEILIG